MDLPSPRCFSTFISVNARRERRDPAGRFLPVRLQANEMPTRVMMSSANLFLGSSGATPFILLQSSSWLPADSSSYSFPIWIHLSFQSTETFWVNAILVYSSNNVLVIAKKTPSNLFFWKCDQLWFQLWLTNSLAPFYWLSTKRNSVIWCLWKSCRGDYWFPRGITLPHSEQLFQLLLSPLSPWKIMCRFWSWHRGE